MARGWKISAISLDLEGDINITSVWGVGDLSPKPVGLTDVRIKAHLDVDGASPNEIAEGGGARGEVVARVQYRSESGADVDRERVTKSGTRN